ncbi:MAG TPA: ATP-binding cassette domain-containing protein [Burkholderiaceae bacterium]|nr:ATP-binding cassette domain-containing protein [Burkholderiaceae bacterium]
MTAAIEVAGLCKSYAAIEVLRNVSFTVAEREAFAIIGPNGAGKTTLFKVMTGEAGANSGRISWRGRDVTALPAAERVNAGFGRTFQVARIFPEFTVRDNIVVAIEARARSRRNGQGSWWDFRPTRACRAEAEQMAESLGLQHALESDARYLSHGDKKRLEIAITLVIIEHDMDVVFGLADRVMVLNYGETIALGTVADVKANESVREVYLGKEMAGA